MAAQHPVDLVGGIVAYNEERRVGTAIRSLLSQELPHGMRWGAIWVVASGCSDGTTAVVERISEKHPVVRLVVEASRRGKAAALREVFSRATGEFLILLNADAAAEPAAVRTLLHFAASVEPPFAIMARPVPPEPASRGFAEGIQLLWEIHDRLHEHMLRTGRGTHLSDELLLLPIGHLPPLPEGIVNDGAFVGGWIRRSGGRLLYAPEARVRIEVPQTLSDHLRQRRRIHYGHMQVGELLGLPPSTLERLAWEDPYAAFAIVRSAVKGRPRGLQSLAWLVLGELGSLAWAVWDRLPPRHDHRLWEPIRDSGGFRPRTSGRVDRTAPSPAPSDRSA